MGFPPAKLGSPPPPHGKESNARGEEVYFVARTTITALGVYSTEPPTCIRTLPRTMTLTQDRSAHA